MALCSKRILGSVEPAFIRVTFSDTEVSTLDGVQTSKRPKSNPKVNKNFPPPKPEYTSQALFFKHLVALEVKRFHYARRNKKGLFCEVRAKIKLIVKARIRLG